MMDGSAYIQRRDDLQAYFDRTALEAWRTLTSDTPVGKIRSSVRAGRDRMRSQLLEWLPYDLRGRRFLDAGCGTGAMSCEAARRGAKVTAVDISPSLIEIARQRTPTDLPQRPTYFAGDMLSDDFGRFDHIVAMDSLIHYDTTDIVDALARLARRAERSILFTVAPRTFLLQVMHVAGRAFPRSNRAPAIVPVNEQDLRERIAHEPQLAGWSIVRSAKIMTTFYKSQAFALVRA